MRQDIYNKIDLERYRQDELYGEKNAAIPALAHKWLTLVMEELGESAMTLDYIDTNLASGKPVEELIKHYGVELIQTAALLVQLLEALKKEFPELF